MGDLFVTAPLQDDKKKLGYAICGCALLLEDVQTQVPYYATCSQ